MEECRIKVLPVGTLLSPRPGNTLFSFLLIGTVARQTLDQEVLGSSHFVVSLGRTLYFHVHIVA